jgi:hypothetical protein
MTQKEHAKLIQLLDQPGAVQVAVRHLWQRHVQFLAVVQIVRELEDIHARTRLCQLKKLIQQAWDRIESRHERSGAPMPPEICEAQDDFRRAIRDWFSLDCTCSACQSSDPKE